MNKLFESQGKTPPRIDDTEKVISPKGVEVDMKKLHFEIESAKIAIISQAPLFGPYVHELTTIYTWYFDTMATDGTRLFINPEFAQELTWPQKIFVLMHELMHCLLLHVSRGKNYEQRKFNYAADYEINAILADIEDDFSPEFVKELQGLYDVKYLNWGAEAIYADIPEPPPPPPGQKGQGQGQPQPGQGQGQGQPGQGQGQGQPGQGQGQPGQGQGQGQPGQGQGQGQPGQGKGEGEGEGEGGTKVWSASDLNPALKNKAASMDPGNTGAVISEDLGKTIAAASGYSDEDMKADNPNTEKDWNNKSKDLMKRAASKGTGTGRGSSLVNALGEIHNNVVNWQAVLANFVGRALSNKSKEWRMPNRRYMAGSPDTFRYGMRKKAKDLDKIVVCVDVSGSMGDELIELCLNEINGIIFSKKVSEIIVLFFDDGVSEPQIIKSQNQKPFLIKDGVIGGGGTNFQKPLDVVSRLYNDKINLMVFMTDTGAPMPKEPPYANKFIWLATDAPAFDAPFGSCIHLNSKKLGIDHFKSVSESIHDFMLKFQSLNENVTFKFYEDL